MPLASFELQRLKPAQVGHVIDVGIRNLTHSFDLRDLMFEADDPLVWNRYIRDHGPHVNLFVDSSRVLRLEASRLGGWAQPTGVVNRVATFLPGHLEPGEGDG